MDSSRRVWYSALGAGERESEKEKAKERERDRRRASALPHPFQDAALLQPPAPPPPLQRRRPGRPAIDMVKVVFLGASGVGKTAIVEVRSRYGHSRTTVPTSGIFVTHHGTYKFIALNDISNPCICIYSKPSSKCSRFKGLLK